MRQLNPVACWKSCNPHATIKVLRFARSSQIKLLDRSFPLFHSLPFSRQSIRLRFVSRSIQRSYHFFSSPSSVNLSGPSTLLPTSFMRRSTSLCTFALLQLGFNLLTTSLPLAFFPFLNKYLGDSGSENERTSCKTAGRIPKPNIQRQACEVVKWKQIASTT